MDFYLTSIKTGRRLHFPLNPQKVSAQTGTRMQSFEIIEAGEVKLPRGLVPAVISWDGIFPGAARQNMSFIKNWQPPGELVDLLQEFRNNQERLRLLITGTPILADVYVDQFTHTWGGGYGDCEYTLQLVQARDIKVYTEAEWKARKNAAKHQGITASRTAPPPPKTHTVKPGDTLALIAKRTLGSTTKWRTIYDDPANRKKIGPDPSNLKVGITLQMPTGGGSR